MEKLLVVLKIHSNYKLHGKVFMTSGDLENRSRSTTFNRVLVLPMVNRNMNTVLSKSGLQHDHNGHTDRQPDSQHE